MRVYEEKTLDEWSRKLRSMYGADFRLYDGEKETLERWADHLSAIFKRRFEIRDSLKETLVEWSRLIGG